MAIYSILGSYLFTSNISCSKCLLFSSTLFLIGLLGIILNENNFIVLMLCIELILLSAMLNFTIFSIFFLDPRGEIYALIVLTVAAAESAVGLGLLIAAFHLKKKINFYSFKSLKF